MSEQTHREPIALAAPAWTQTRTVTQGLFPLGSDGRSIPGEWQPRGCRYQPAAFPTPFARAETMRLVLANIDEAADPKSADPQSTDAPHAFVAPFKWLTLGVVTGVLQLEPDDLRSAEFDNLGKALTRIDPDSRYFCWVKNAKDGQVFAATYRSGLFAPHARRVQSDWDALAATVKPSEHEALQLLADWREAIHRAHRWDPTMPMCEWQKGIDWILAGTGVSPTQDLDSLNDHCRFVGPVDICLPTGRPEEPVRREPLYLPTLAHDFARRFISVCRLKPAEDKEKKRAAFRGESGREIAWIELPDQGADTDPVALGAGTTCLNDEIQYVESEGETLWLEDQGGERGLKSLLKPLYLALQKLNRPVDIEHVHACPVLYPDVVRFVTAWTGEKLCRSAALTALCVRKNVVLRKTGVEAAGGVVVQLGTGSRTCDLAYLDFLGEEPVLDLRALGFVLWSFFTKDAELAESAVGFRVERVRDSEGLLWHKEDRPLEPREWIYQAVANSPGEQLQVRVASMQRFLRAYRDSESGLAHLCHTAASSFVQWASGRADLGPLGRPAADKGGYKLPTGDLMDLWIDSLAK